MAELRLGHATVGRISPTTSMGVVDIASAEQAVVQFFGEPTTTTLSVGVPVTVAGVEVTLVEAHPRTPDRPSHIVVATGPAGRL